MLLKSKGAKGEGYGVGVVGIAISVEGSVLGAGLGSGGDRSTGGQLQVVKRLQEEWNWDMIK